MVLTREAGNVLAGEGSTSKALREEGAALGVLEDGDDHPPPPPHVAGPQRERGEQAGNDPEGGDHAGSGCGSLRRIFIFMLVGNYLRL